MPERRLASYVAATDDELLAELEHLSRQLAAAAESLAVDRGARQRQFWETWAKLNPDAPVAAKNRECEYQVRALDAHICMQEGVIASWAALAACVRDMLRARGR